MREIKFRAWDKVLKQMFPVQIIVFPIHHGIGLFELKGNPRLPARHGGGEIKLMQYTGLKDRNGKEIYEGDISLSLMSKGKFIVSWNTIFASFVLQEENDPSYELSMVNLTEVIGNIYEGIKDD